MQSFLSVTGEAGGDWVDGHAARLGTVVTVLVAWTEFWYKVGSPSLGTKSVATRGQSIVRRAQVA